MSSLVKIWELDDPELPKDLFMLRDVFLPKPKPVNDRGYKESLHDYFQRKNIKCFCNKCRVLIKEKEQKKQSLLF